MKYKFIKKYLKTEIFQVLILAKLVQIYHIANTMHDDLTCTRNFWTCNSLD